MEVRKDKSTEGTHNYVKYINCLLSLENKVNRKILPPGEIQTLNSKMYVHST